RQGETGEAGLARGESVLHETLRLLRGTALPCHEHQGRCPRNAPGLEDSQGVGEAVYEGATAQSWNAGSPNDWSRRDLDPQRPYLPHRGERPDSKTPDLVRRRGPQRGEHVAVLRLAGEKKTRGMRLAVMDMWKPFYNVTATRAPQAAILYDKFHILRHLGDALDEVRKSEYRRLSGQDRSYIKGQKYTLLSHRENLTLKGRQALKKVLTANQR